MLCHVVSYYVKLCYVMVCYVMLCYVLICYVRLCYVMLCYGLLCYVMLCHAMSCYVSSCYVMLCDAMLCYFMLCYRPKHNTVEKMKPRETHSKPTGDPFPRSCVAYILANVTGRSHDVGSLLALPRRQALLVSPALCPNPRGRSRSVHPRHGCGRQLPPEGEDGVPPPQRI